LSIADLKYEAVTFGSVIGWARYDGIPLGRVSVSKGLPVASVSVTELLAPQAMTQLPFFNRRALPQQLDPWMPLRVKMLTMVAVRATVSIL
jgi:hypothetical protein